MIRRDAWESAGGFDEAFEKGGEDRDLARRLLESGQSITFDPVMAIHHTHGLSFINRLRRTHTLALAGFTGRSASFDRAEMAKQRPDLKMLN